MIRIDEIDEEELGLIHSRVAASLILAGIKPGSPETIVTRPLPLAGAGVASSSPKQDAPASITRRTDSPKATFRRNRMVAESSVFSGQRKSTP